MSAEEEIIIDAQGSTFLPVGKPISLLTILSGYVELSQPATLRDLRVLSGVTKSQETKDKLETLKSSYADLVLKKRLSIIDILEAHPDIELPFGNLLFLLPAMRIRQYSISSSSLADPQKASVTISVVEGPAFSGSKRRFRGVASTFLSGLVPGDFVQLAVRSASS
jgi:cytochrome P450 / NADPH-cytochrome P450 reductase